MTKPNTMMDKPAIRPEVVAARSDMGPPVKAIGALL
jgi:hypothetical protein